MHIRERPAAATRAESARPKPVEPVDRRMPKRGVELSSQKSRGAGIARRGNQFGGDPADAAVEGQAGAAAEIEHDLFQPELAGFRRVDRMQLTLFQGDAAGRQKFAVEASLAQGEVDPRALGVALSQVEAGSEGPGNRCLEMLELGQLRDDR